MFLVLPRAFSKRKNKIMKISEPVIEDGIIAGNLYDKYGARNPIARYLMKGFYDSLNKLVTVSGATEIHEVGCGEGNLCIKLAKQNKSVRASDVSKKIIDKARAKAEADKVNVVFKGASIYDLKPATDSAELIICCEVLEHLERPEEALLVLTNLAKPYAIISVPREPIWRILNFIRGKYMADLGNTPGHIQHWSKEGFLRFLSSRFDVVKVLTPFPWTMVLCRSKKR